MIKAKSRNKRILQQNGITLVSLVITIILLLMLATISIQALTGSGLFQKATDAKEQAKLAELEEQMNLAITEMIANKNGGKIAIEDYINHLTEKEKINITGRYVEDGKQIIVVEDKYVFEIIEDDPYIRVEKVGVKDKLPPILTISSITNTTSSITVEITSKRNEGGKIEYYIKAEDEDKYVLRETQIDGTNKYTYTGLEQNKKYNIKIVAIAKNKQTAEILVDRTTGDVPDLVEEDITFTFEPNGWTNGSVKVTATLNIEINSSYTLKITDSNPTTVTDKQTVLEWEDASDGITVDSNTLIFAVLADNEGQVGDAVSGNVEKIDTVAPTISTELSPTSAGIDSVTLSVGVTDTDSGLGKLEWYYGTTDNPTTLAGTTNVTDLNGTEEGPTTAQTKTATVTGLSAGTTYYFKVIAYDVAGNPTTSTVISATTISPTAGDISYTPSDTSWNVDNVKSALDALYNR